MENINLKLEKFIIEEDYTNGLYKILSVKPLKRILEIIYAKP